MQWSRRKRERKNDENDKNDDDDDDNSVLCSPGYAGCRRDGNLRILRAYVDGHIIYTDDASFPVQLRPACAVSATICVIAGTGRRSGPPETTIDDMIHTRVRQRIMTFVGGRGRGNTYGNGVGRARRDAAVLRRITCPLGRTSPRRRRSAVSPENVMQRRLATRKRKERWRHGCPRVLIITSVLRDGSAASGRRRGKRVRCCYVETTTAWRLFGMTRRLCGWCPID